MANESQAEVAVWCLQDWSLVKRYIGSLFCLSSFQIDASLKAGDPAAILGNGGHIVKKTKQTEKDTGFLVISRS